MQSNTDSLRTADGRSTGARGDMGQPQALLTDLSAAMARLRGAGQHGLLGHSMGGLVAARLVAESRAGNPRRHRLRC